MDYETIEVTVEDKTIWVGLNRPKVLNAMNFEMINEVIDAFTKLMRAKTDRLQTLLEDGTHSATCRQIASELVDVAEGADFLMVKPALAYLDILRQLRDEYPQVPLVAYNVSGEYAMVKAASAQGWLDERRTVMEILQGIKRAGADNILTYHAKQVAGWLREID